MVKARQTIALAGVGDLGRYVCEELLESSQFDIVVLTREYGHKSWLVHDRITTFSTDYTASSILSILNASLATTLISFINIPDPKYITVHSALLTACQRSTACKRLIPSEWIGDVEAYPLKPNFYALTREPFRHILRAQIEVEWTLFNVGWLTDYFLPSAKTYMKPIPQEFPVDPNGWKACVRGNGDEVQSWTCARDAGKAVVDLCKAEHWERVTYVAGEWSTFNNAIGVMERYFGRPLPISRKPWQDVQCVLDAYAGKDEITDELELAQVEEMMVMSCLACPKAKTLRQREKYFSNIHFRGLEELLQSAEKLKIVNNLNFLTIYQNVWGPHWRQDDRKTAGGSNVEHPSIPLNHETFIHPTLVSLDRLELLTRRREKRSKAEERSDTIAVRVIFPKPLTIRRITSPTLCLPRLLHLQISIGFPRKEDLGEGVDGVIETVVVM